MFRYLLVGALAAGYATAANAQSLSERLGTPALRAEVLVSSDIVRIGDLVENAGASARIAVYRAPDPGTTGTLPVAQVLDVLRNYQLFGVDTRDLQTVAITRNARTISTREIEAEIARALAQQGGIGDAADIALTFDREPRPLQLDAAMTAPLRAIATRRDPRSARFDVTFEIAGAANNAPVRLRYTGTAVETVETAVLTRTVERGEVLKAGDVAMERRPRTEVGPETFPAERAQGLQARRTLRLGQPLKQADLGKADLVQKDQPVMLIYEAPGLYLTMRGKTLDNGAEGDTVNVLNLQSKRTVTGIVIGPGRVSISPPAAPQSAPVAISAAAPAQQTASSERAKTQDRIMPTTKSAQAE